MSCDSTSIVFTVAPDHIKLLPDPNGKGRRRWFAQVPVDQVHRARVSFGPNPREQNLETKVAEAIDESLRENLGWFLYFNKGIVLCAKEVHYDNKKMRLTLTFEKNIEDPWDSPHGNLDGGHTNAVILRAIDKGWRNPADDGSKQYVTVEILTGIDPDRLSDLVGARNTNIPVKDLALAVLGDELDWLLKILEKAGVKDKIAWRQFDTSAKVRGEDVLAYLSLLNAELKEKIRCYSGAGRIVSELKRRPEHKEDGNPMMNGLRKTAPVAVEFLRFVDWMHARFEEWYTAAKSEVGEGAKFGNLKGITLMDGEDHELIFLGEWIRYRAAKSWLMPMAYAFTDVVSREPKSSQVWKKVAKKVGTKLMETLVTHTKSERGNLNAVGKNKAIWDNLRAHVEAAYWETKAKAGEGR